MRTNYSHFWALGGRPLFLLLFFFFSSTVANFCETEDTLPYYLRVSPNGTLQLACRRLKCFFDGNGEERIQALNGDDTKREHTINRTICRSVSWTSPCSAERQGWFAGDASSSETKKCCYSEGLKSYKLHSQSLVHSGEEYIGGQVLHGDRQVAFDFISDVRKLNDGNNRIKYLAVMSRLACLPEPSELSNDVERGLNEEIFDEFEALNQAGVANAKIHGVDTNTPSKNDTTVNKQSNKLQPPPKLNTTTASSAPERENFSPSIDESSANNCFTSPSGHRCCSRQVETLLREMSSAVSSEIDEDTNTSTVQHRMIHYINDAAKGRFGESCGRFETIISKGEFAAKSHIRADDGEVLGCKMQVRIGGDRFRRQADGAAGGFVFIVLTYAMVPSATNRNSFSIDFTEFPEIPLVQPVETFGFAPPAFANPVAAPAFANPAPFVQLYQAPVVQAAPIAVGGGGGGGGGCFSGDTTIETDKGTKRMDELVIGDNVLSADMHTPTFSPVITFLHRLPHRRMAFYQIEALSGTSTTIIKLTGNHFIYVTDCKKIKHRRIYAADVKIGHCLFLLNEKRTLFLPTPVTNVSKVWQSGIYSPLTTTGTITVNNILASCHSSVTGHHGLHQTFHHWIEVVNSWIAWAAFCLNLRIFDGEVFELARGVEFVLSVIGMILPSL